MTAFVVFTESEPLLVVAPRGAAVEGRLAGALNSRGIEKYLAHEVPLDRLREEYGRSFEVIEADIRDGADLRVLDSKGSHVFAKVRFADLGPGIAHGLSH
jgi:hypothetical protein